MGQYAKSILPLLVAVLPAFLPASWSEITQRHFQVPCVIDGDTFVAHYDGEPTSARLLPPGVEFSEHRAPGAVETTEFVEQLLGGRMVRLSFGRPLCSVSVNDSVLATVRVAAVAAR